MNSFLTEMQFFSIQFDFHRENKIHKISLQLSFKNFPNAFKKQLFCRTSLDGYQLKQPQQSFCILFTLGSETLGSRMFHKFWIDSRKFITVKNSFLADSRKFILAYFFMKSKIFSMKPKVLNCERTKKVINFAVRKS